MHKLFLTADRKSLACFSRNAGVVAFLVPLLSACASLPSSGPTASRIVNSASAADGNLGYNVVNVSEMADLPGPLPMSESWIVPPATHRRLAVGSGDMLSIRIFEIGTRLFSGTSMNGSAPSMAAPTAQGESLPPVQVDEAGNIALPYVGTLHVAGQTTSEIEQLINRRYAPYSQALRSMVSVGRNEANKVVVAGAVNRAGRFDLTAAHERVLDAISDAGGVSGRAEDIVVRLTRGGVTASARLRQIMDDPRMNEPLAGGDVLELDLLPQTYSVFGASGRVSQVPFNADRVSLAEAIARAGGPLDNQADPSGIFLFRQNPADLSGARTIYRLDLMQPSSYFISQNFYLNDKDVIYFANSQSNQASKFVQILNQLFSPFLTVRAIAN